MPKLVKFIREVGHQKWTTVHCMQARVAWTSANPSKKKLPQFSFWPIYKRKKIIIALYLLVDFVKAKQVDIEIYFVEIIYSKF